MSIFGDHIVESDEILSKWYIIPEKNGEFDPWDCWDGGLKWGRGWMFPNRKAAPEDIQKDGYYCTMWAAYDEWRPGRVWKIVDQYHIDMLSGIRINKKHYFRQFHKAYDRGEIKAHVYKGEYYYKWRDVCSFHTLYEIELIVKHCKKHKYHWDGPLEP